MTERFVSIKVLSDSASADRTCSILEEAGIPVLIQHLEIEEGTLKASGYRVLAPAHCAQTAMKLLNVRQTASAALRAA